MEHDVCQERNNLDVWQENTTCCWYSICAHSCRMQQKTVKINTLLRGAVAGCVATAPMTVVMTALHHLLPRNEQYPLPPSEIVEQIAENVHVEQHIDRQQHVLLTLLGHFGYGAAVGGGYPLLAPRLPFGAATNGIVYGLGVWTISYLGLLPAAGLLAPATEHPARRNALMIVAHVVWGAATGWLFEQMQRDRARQGDRARGR